MSEPETLSSAEPLEQHLARHAFDRLIMLSDGVFAIATTLAAIEVKLPEHAHSVGELLAGGGVQILTYVFSFAIAAAFWIQNRDLFARLRRVDLPITALTLAMLCLVALIPAMVHIAYAPGGTQAPFRLYAVLMLGIGAVNFAMWLYAILRPGMMRPGVTRQFRAQRLVASGVPLVVLPPAVVLPIEQSGPIIVLGALPAALLIRVLLPRWFANRVPGHA